MKKYRVKKSKEELRTIRSDAMNKVIAVKNEIKRTHPNWSKEKINEEYAWRSYQEWQVKNVDRLKLIRREIPGQEPIATPDVLNKEKFLSRYREGVVVTEKNIKTGKLEKVIKHSIEAIKQDVTIRTNITTLNTLLEKYKEKLADTYSEEEVPKKLLEKKQELKKQYNEKSLQKLTTKQLAEILKDEINNKRDELFKQGLSRKEVALQISEYYFGS